MSKKGRYDPESDEVYLTKQQEAAVAALERAFRKMDESGLMLFIWSGSPALYKKEEYWLHAHEDDFMHRRIIHLESSASFDGGDP